MSQSAHAHRSIEIGTTIARGEVDEPELRIERRSVPDGRAAPHRMIGIGRPRICAELTGAGQGVRSALEDLAGLGVERSEPARALWVMVGLLAFVMLLPTIKR